MNLLNALFDDAVSRSRRSKNRKAANPRGEKPPCLICGNPTKEARGKLCSIACAEVYKKARWVALYETAPKRCRHCSAIIPYEKRENKFCNSSCAAKGQPSRSRPHSPETKARLSDIEHKRLANQSTAERQVWLNKTRAGSMKRRKIRKCLTCKTDFFSSTRKTCSRACHRRFCQISNATKRGTGRGKSGYYAGIYCSSTYELAFVIWATDWGLPIKRSSLAIPYVSGGKGRIYYPDFEINGITYEIKGMRRKEDGAKAAAARKLGPYELIDKKGIQKYIDHVEGKYLRPLTEIYASLYGSRQKHQYQCARCGLVFERNRKHKGTRPFCTQRCAGLFRSDIKWAGPSEESRTPEVSE